MFEVTGGGAILQFLLYEEFLSVLPTANVICLLIITSGSPLWYKCYIRRFYQAWIEIFAKQLQLY